MVRPRSAPQLLRLYPRYKHLYPNNLSGSCENRLNGRADAYKTGPCEDLCLGEIQRGSAKWVPAQELRATHILVLYAHQVVQPWQGSPCPSDAIAAFSGDFSHTLGNTAPKM